LRTQTLIVAGNPELQDRVEIFTAADRKIVALSDGAGGISGGSQAAEAFIRMVAEQGTSLKNGSDCRNLLQTADQLISNEPAAGEATGIVLIAGPTHIFGASVGDSEAWLFSSFAKHHLTEKQRRKPLLGSGAAISNAFSFNPAEAMLLVASDGLWKYTSIEKITAEIQSNDPSTLPERLVNLVRLRSGALQDDVALAVVHFP
jgi:serine/threonine protein phosphatase PrpC